MYVLGNLLANPVAIFAVIALVVLLFGGQKIPELMRSIGRGKNEFEKGLREGGPDDDELRRDREREAEIRRLGEEAVRKQEMQKGK